MVGVRSERISTPPWLHSGKLIICQIKFYSDLKITQHLVIAFTATIQRFAFLTGNSLDFACWYISLLYMCEIEDFAYVVTDIVSGVSHF